MGWRHSAVFCLAAALVPAETWAARLTGRASVSGHLPPQVVLPAHHDGHVCGAKEPLLSEEVLASPDGGLANVVVVVKDAKGAGRPATAKLMQRNCTFVPHVQSVSIGSTLLISNDDPILHNVHAFLGEQTLFNLAMPLKGQVVRRTLKSPGIVSLRCDSGHTWMSAFVVVVPHPFHATTASDGRFVIDGVPPGHYTVQSWHEKLGHLETQADVGETTVDVAFTYTLSQKAALEADPAVSRQAVAAQLGKMENALNALRKARAAVDDLSRRLQASEAVSREAVAAQLGKMEETLSALHKARAMVDDLSHRLHASEAERARPLYLRHCATCHGERGDGKGPSAPLIDLQPRDFTRGEYQFRMTVSGTPAREVDIYRTITTGVLGTPMPSWGNILTSDERSLLARHLMSLAPRFAEDDPGEVIEIPPESANDAASVTRGKEIYVQMKCAQCHGETGRGDGTSADTTKDDWGNPVKPYDLTRDYFQGGRGAAVIYRAISTGLSGSPMPSYADFMEPPQRWDLVHYIVSLAEPRGLLNYLFADPAGRMAPP